jgi:hypothetical protein
MNHNSTTPISPAQLAANRANAQLSRGPVTQPGKRRSSLNAIRHGLTSRIVVLPNEDVNQYREFAEKIIVSLQPRGPLEDTLAQTIADQYWRLNRIRSIEDGLLALGHVEEAGDFDANHPDTHASLTAARAFRDHSQSFVNLSVYEQRIHRVLEKTIKQLKEMQAERLAQKQADLEEAITQHKFHKMQGLTYDPREDGFDFTRLLIESESTRQDRRREAEIAKKVGYNLTAFRAHQEKSQETAAA